MNYLGCANCHQKDFVLINNKAINDEDGEEVVTYDRECVCLCIILDTMFRVQCLDLF